jgi:hypothetical protein
MIYLFCNAGYVYGSLTYGNSKDTSRLLKIFLRDCTKFNTIKDCAGVLAKRRKEYSFFLERLREYLLKIDLEKEQCFYLNDFELKELQSYIDRYSMLL